MGKLIKEKYSDINFRILKEAKKRKRAEQQQRECSSSSSSQEPVFKKQKKGSTIENNGKLNHTQISDKVKVNEDTSDLFSTDEIRSSYLSYPHKDFYLHIIEEICLEGLDGITLQAFWKRFFTALECPLIVSDRLKEIIWRIICDNEIFTFYSLDEERGKLLIADVKRDNRGTVIDPVDLSDIYPVVTVQDFDNRGSCATYETRVDVSSKVRKMDLKNVEKLYGRKLVIMANQESRNKVLFLEEDPLVELQLIEYCLLERIARARKVGEMSQGNSALTISFQIDCGSLFHYQKVLLKNRLIKKQKFFIKDPLNIQYKTGNIIHSSKYYKKIKTLQLLIAEQIVNILKMQPNCRMAISDLKKVFPFLEPTIKVIKNPEFRKFIKEDNVYPYREIYPNATRKEYARKSDGFEKHVKCFELVNPHINVSACWNQNVNEDSDEEGEEEEGEDVASGSKVYNMELFREVYYHIFSKGANGMSQMDLVLLIGVDKNSIRMALKKLLTKKVIFIKKWDAGKQRKLLYYAKCLENPNLNVTELNKQISTSSTQKISKFKSKLIDRQRAALAKTNSVKNVGDIVPDIHSPFSRFQTLTVLSQSAIISYLVKKDFKIPNFIETEDVTLFPKLVRYFSIPLTFVSLKGDIEINKCIQEAKFPSTVLPGKDFVNFLTENKEKNVIMNLILLKAHFGEVKLIHISTYMNRKRSHSELESPKVEKRTELAPNKRLGVGLLNFMGDSPRIVHECQDKNLKIVIYLSTPPKEVNYDSVYPKKIDLSKRMINRCQMILDVINEKKIQDDHYKFIRYITNEEAKKGQYEKIDRKSLARILRKLMIEGYIKIYQLVVSNDSLRKSTYFVCHPTIYHTDSSISAVLDQWKWKYFYPSTVSKPEPKEIAIKKDPEDQSVLIFKEFDVLESIEELNEMNQQGRKVQAKFIRQLGKVHGLKPKCIRMRILHEFLFYLVYENHKQSKEPLSKPEVNDLFKKYLIDLSEQDLEAMPPIFCKEISWKMFIPRMPEHKGWDIGWILLCDVILRLPISIFCQIHGCSFKLQELDDILSHPIKRFYLLKDLSLDIRSVVLHKRKFLTTIYDTLDRLAFCGLIQFGPQKCKIKDQAFIYVNRRASLLDTTSSEPSYFKVTDKEYQQLNFFFNEPTDVDNYWYNVYIICLNTKLNKKTSGQIITFIDVSARPDLQAALRHKTPEEALEYDDGRIYGDKRGAAGLDSSLWAHLARNWFWASRKKVDSLELKGLQSEKMDKVLPHLMEYSNLHQNSWNKVYLAKDKTSTNKMTNILKSRIRTKTSKSFQKIIKKLKPRPKKPYKREYYDEVDTAIRKENGLKTRVKFSKAEDDYLLLCLAAEFFLTPKKAVKKRAVSFFVVRDLLHRMCPESKNKTSRAIQRRFKILLYQNTNHLEENVENFRKIKEIEEYFGELCGRNENVQLSDLQTGVAFIFLMSYINKYKSEFSSILRGVTTRTDYLRDTNLEYVENNLIDLNEEPLKFVEPKEDNDIKINVLKSVIHSSLALNTQPTLALQLFKIYQQYPDYLIKEAVNELKNTQTISNKRFELKKNRIYWQIPFKLSRMYILIQCATFNTITAIQAYKTILAILNEDFTEFGVSVEQVESKKYGQLLSVNELFTCWKNISLSFDLPQNMVILDPSIRDHDDLIHELAIRYQLQLKNMLQDSICDNEQDQDTDKFRNSQSEVEVNLQEEVNKSVAVFESKDFDTELVDLTEDNSLDMIGGGAEAINRLRTWVTDCMEEQRERSPSPQFFQIKEEPDLELDSSNQPQIGTDSREYFGNVSKISSNSQIPSLEEIKEEMLRPTTLNEERSIPYITELSGLLNKDTFNELNTDENRLEQLKSHFITHFAKLECLVVKDLDGMKEKFMVDTLDHTNHSVLWNKIQNDVKITWTITDVFELVKDRGGTDEDCVLAIDIIEFIKQKLVFGATGPEIKEMFSNAEKSLDLVDILQILIDSKVVLKTGICKIRFVHYKHQSSWLIETFELSEEEKSVEVRSEENEEEDKEIMEQKLKKQKLMNIKVAPWIRIDGRLNEDALKTWLCNLLSHTLEYPKIAFPKLCEKFCHVKPIDIYHLLEILQQLGCIELLFHENKNQNLFSQWETPIRRKANILDNLEHIIVEPNNRSMTCLGSFLYYLENK